MLITVPLEEHSKAKRIILMVVSHATANSKLLRLIGRVDKNLFPELYIWWVNSVILKATI